MAVTNNKTVLAFLQDVKTMSGKTKISALIKEHGLRVRLGTALRKSALVSTNTETYVWKSEVIPNVKMAEKLINEAKQLKRAANVKYNAKVKKKTTGCPTSKLAEFHDHDEVLQKEDSMKKIHAEAAMIDAKEKRDAFEEAAEILAQEENEVIEETSTESKGIFRWLRKAFGYKNSNELV